MEASVVVAEGLESKKEEAKNENKDDSSSKKKEAAFAVAVDSCNGEATNAAATSNDSSSQKENSRKKKSNKRIQVSNTKKPFSFYLNLAKTYIKQSYDVEISALGMAIPTVVTIAEVLKRDGLANNKEIRISTVDSKEKDKGRFAGKSKIQIVLAKAQNLNKSTADATPPKMDGDNKA